jgi:CDP-diacylglycerol---glycerol-3-phosphate 3-phosphatidyltransferase
MVTTPGAPKAGIFAYWPNRITGIRFLGAVVLFVLLSLEGVSGPLPERGLASLAFWLFVIVAATDVLDGWLARRGNQVTAFGRVADPFVDKILVLGAMVFLAVPWTGPNPVPAGLGRGRCPEPRVPGDRHPRLRGERSGGAFPADWFGKIKMVAQCVAVGAILGRFALAWGVPGSDRVEALVARQPSGRRCVTSVGSGLWLRAQVAQDPASRVRDDGATHSSIWPAPSSRTSATRRWRRAPSAPSVAWRSPGPCRRQLGFPTSGCC